MTTSLTVAGSQTSGTRVSGTDNAIVLQAKVEKNQGTHYTAQHVASKIDYLGTVSPDTSSSGIFYDDAYTITSPPPPTFDTRWQTRGPSLPDMTICPQQFNPRQVRLSANRFQHDTTLTICARVEYDVYDLDEEGMAVKVGHIVHDQVSLTVRVWNRLTRYKILYTTGGTPWSGNDLSWINEHLAYGTTRLAQGGYYYPLNEPPEQHKNTIGSQTGILTDLAEANGIFASCHGEDNGIHDSYGYQGGPNSGQNPDTLMTLSELATATGSTANPPRTPAMNLVLLYSCRCATFPDPVATFNLRKVDGLVRDAVLFAFEDDVYPWVLTKTEYDQQPTNSRPKNFRFHVEALLDDLLAGYRAEVAWQRDQDTWRVVRPGPLPGTYIDCGLQLFGDGGFTLRSVYHPEGEIGSDPNQAGIYRTPTGTYASWYRLFPKEVLQ